MISAGAVSQWRPLPKAIGASIAFVLLGTVFTSLITASWAAVTYGDLMSGLRRLERPGALQALVAGVSQVLGFGLATWIVAFRWLRLGREDLRWCRAREGLPGFGWGTLLGIVPALVAVFLAVPIGGAGWVRDQGDLADYVVQVGKTTLALAPAALSEEVIFRGVPLVLLAAAVGRLAALLALSILFGLGHVFNPDVGYFGIANIALAGVLLSFAFFAPGGIWTAFGAHLGWNATLAALDAPVSGLPFLIPLIDYRSGGPPWLTGGSFGPEGGLTATIAILLGTAVAARWSRAGQRRGGAPT